ncbi:MAG: DUF6132 family protein [Paludibacter sp.]|nr:DUF6132 family protein [Paludibacter sp.]
MTEFIKKYLLRIIGVVAGVIGGFVYYYYVGCQSGTCPITSNPYASIVFGGIFGYLLFDLFTKKEKKGNGSN